MAPGPMGRRHDAARGTARRQAKPALPDDFAQWKPEDFVSAKEANDPKLAQAIEALGKANAGKPIVATIARAILKAAEPKEKPKEQPRRDRPSRGLPGRRWAIRWAWVCRWA